MKKTSMLIASYEKAALRTPSTATSLPHNARDAEPTMGSVIPMPPPSRTSSGVAACASIASVSPAIASANSTTITSSGRVGPNRSISLPCTTDPAETPTSDPADTSPAAANEPVSRWTYSNAERPIIAIGRRASNDATRGRVEPGVVRAAR